MQIVTKLFNEGGEVNRVTEKDKFEIQEILAQDFS